MEMSYTVLSAQFTRSRFSAILLVTSVPTEQPNIKLYCQLSPHGKVLIMCTVSSDLTNQSYSTLEFQLRPHGKALEYTVLSDQSSQSSLIAHCIVISVDTEGSPSAHYTVGSLPKEQIYNTLYCQPCLHGAA